MSEWSKVGLGMLLTDIQPGFASGRHNSDGRGIPHYRPMNVSTDGRIERSVMKYVEPSAGRAEIRLRAGDILFNNTNSPELVGKTALFEGDDAPAFSNHMTRLRVDETRLDPSYTALRLHQAWREGWFAAHCNNHVSQASIGRDVLRTFEIELPPLHVQRAIASLSSRVDNSRASASSHLAAARGAVARFRQAVFAAACSGRLTADWRLRHLQVDGEGDLPGGWAVALGREAFPFITSGSRGWARYYSDSGAKFIRVGNLDHDSLDLDLSEIQYVTPPDNAEAKRTAVLPGDLLISITAEIGMVGVAPEDLGPAHVNQHVAIARPAPTYSSRYLACFITSVTGGQTQLGVLQRGATKAGLGLDDLRALRIPIPPREEQDEIVRRVDQMLSLADGLKKRIDTASKRVDHTSQCVLAKAFRGELAAVGDGA